MDMTFHMHILDTVTRAWIQDEAQRTGSSLESVVARLIQRGIVAERQAAHPQRYHDLDVLAGTWTSEEAEAFRRVTTDFAQIESALWQ